jgi:hypothetical protein
MTPAEEQRLLGSPDDGWGLPHPGAGRTELYSELWGDRTQIVRYADGRVADPPTEIVPRTFLVE